MYNLTRTKENTMNYRMPQKTRQDYLPNQTDLVSKYVVGLYNITLELDCALAVQVNMYRESSRYAHFGTGKNSHKWKIAYLESNVV